MNSIQVHAFMYVQKAVEDKLFASQSLLVGCCTGSDCLFA